MLLFKCECGCHFTVKEATPATITKNYHCQNCNTEMCHNIENYDNPSVSQSIKPIGVKIAAGLTFNEIASTLNDNESKLSVFSVSDDVEIIPARLVIQRV
jgi:hypothetical protein